MAAYFWVGGTATWDATAGSKWATTSGGTTFYGTPPTSADTVAFDANSGANTVTIGSSTAICYSLTMTGFTGTLAFGTNSITIAGTGASAGYTGATTFSVSGTPLIRFTATTIFARSVNAGAVTEANSISFTLTGSSSQSFGFSGSVKNIDLSAYTGQMSNNAYTVYGNFTAGTGNTFLNGVNAITFGATSGTQIFTTAGRTFDTPITIDAVGGTVQLADALTMGSTKTLTVNNGTFNANNQNLSIGLFVTSGFNSKTITMGSGTWTLSGTGTVWNIGVASNLTINVNTANIVLSDTSTTARTFSGSTFTYNTITIGGTTGISTTTFGATAGTVIGTLASTKTVAHTITFSAAQTVNNWTVTGTAGNIVTVNSSAVGTQRTLTYSGSGTVSMDYMSIKDINFSYTLGASNPYLVYGGANSTNGGNNAGIAFIAGTSKAYRLTTGTSWTVPSDWNSGNNTIYMIGGGGGGAGNSVGNATNNRIGGSGGGGGGYTVVTNFSTSPSTNITYQIGGSGSGGTGGTTPSGGTGTATGWNSLAYTAGGGQGGQVTTGLTPTATGGTGGTGTNAGGAGGDGVAYGTTTNAASSGGGGGAAGPNGVGGKGGNGGTLVTTVGAGTGQGGGGGNGGGSAGANGTSSLTTGTGGNGGNNFGGTGGGTGGTGAVGTAGTFGGGGGGAGGLFAGGAGGAGIDIANTLGGGGGGGGNGPTSTAPTAALYGAGGGGKAIQSGGTLGNGGAGSQGVIFIVYTPSTTSVNSGFFFLFG